MEGIFGCLAGIFVGLTTSWYFQIKPISEKDNLIQQQRYKFGRDYSSYIQQKGFTLMQTTAWSPDSKANQE